MSGVPPPPVGSPPPAPKPEPPVPPSRLGRLIVGVMLVVFGVGWLLDVLDVTDFRWDVVVPSALILVGAALLVTSRSPAGHGGLMTAGVVLTVLLLIGSVIDFPIGGGVGDREVHPTTAAALRSDYRLGVGQLTLDLGDLSAAEIDAGDVNRIRVRVGIGKLLVIGPPDGSIRVEARAGLGNVRVFGSEEGGFDVQRVAVSEPRALSWVLELVLSVGIGEVEVRRG
jgi:predicted membrane protein